MLHADTDRKGVALSVLFFVFKKALNLILLETSRLTFTYNRGGGV